MLEDLGAKYVLLQTDDKIYDELRKLAS